MHNRYLSILFFSALFVLILPVVGCSHAIPPQISAVPSIAFSTKSSSVVSLPTSTEGHPYPQPILSPFPPTTSEAYPQPITPALPQATSPAYPQPIGPVTATLPQAEITSPPTASQTSLPATHQATPTPSPTPEPSDTETATIQPVATYTATEPLQYPGPQTNETQNYSSQQTAEAQQYPGPEITNTGVPPQNETATPSPSQTPTGSATVTSSSTGTVFPSPTLALGSGTPIATPTEMPPRKPLSPPPPGSNITIWYSWDPGERVVLQTIISSFQKLNPEVTFTLQYMPLDELFSTYREAAYYGKGPSLLLGPASWGPELFKGHLIADLTPYIPSNYLSRINPAAFDAGKYQAALISLPLSQQGVVMFRNSGIIATAPRSFEELIKLSHEATHGGVVGSYLERGAYFSTANILGLGGSLMSVNGLPTFDDNAGLEWIHLLQDYNEAGAVTFNTNYDLNMFTRGRVGIIIEGTWNIQALTQALGADKLAIDPWPSYGNGHLSGWVQADSVFLNSTTIGEDRYAALSFMGYLLDPNVQTRLAEVGHIPSVVTTTPRDPLIQQAMQAFSNGSAYPISVDDSIFNLYLDQLNAALRAIFTGGTKPEEALKAASDEITRVMLNSTPTP